MAVRHCKNCGYTGEAKMPGSGYIEAVLWCFFFFLGVFYSIWRRQGTQCNVCPACNWPYMVKP